MISSLLSFAQPSHIIWMRPIQLYRYQSGFMHQTVILVDEAIAGVGTVNLDNRSYYLNFEVMSFVVNKAGKKMRSRLSLISSKA